MSFFDLNENARSEVRNSIPFEPLGQGFQEDSEVSGQVRELPSPVSARHIREFDLDEDLRGFWQGWRDCNSSFHHRTIHDDPDWIEERFKRQKENVRIYFLESEKKVIGAVPLVLLRGPLECTLGKSVVARFPMRILRLQGYAPNLPSETSAYDGLFAKILESKFDAIQMSHTKMSSFLWSYLHSSMLIRKSFSLYIRSGPLPHPLIQLRGSFASYMSGFSSKARKNRLREIKKMRARE